MSGLYLENQYSKALLDGGFQRIPGWECLYFHPTLQVVSRVYVDDVKLAGRKASLSNAWQLMRDTGLKWDPPEPFNEYLGCGQHNITLTPEEVQKRLEHIHPISVDPDLPTASLDASKLSAGIPVRSIAYGMRGFFQQVVEQYV